MGTKLHLTPKSVLIYSIYSFMIPQITHISEFSQNESIMKINRLYSKIQ